MSNFETRSAVMLVLVASMAASTVSHAADADLSKEQGNAPLLLAASETSSDSAAAPRGEESSQGSAVQSPYSLGGGNVSTGGGLFGSEASGVGIGQRSVTPGYELGSGIASSGRSSAEDGIMTMPGRGRPIRFENGVFIYPSALIGFGRNDNVTGVTNNKIESNIFVLRPELVGEIRTRGDRYTLSYQGNYGRYESSSADDYDHHEFWAAGDNYFTSRARLGWGVGYVQRSDPRGSTDRVAGAEPDKWHAPVLRALGIYGAKGAVGRLELEGSWMQKRYDNNRAVTYLSDVDLTMASGRFFYRVMPKTSAVVELRNTWANYTSSLSTADNTDTRIYGGLVWEATAKTTGTIKLGRAYKRFSDDSRKDADLNSWEAALRWSPLTYSTVDLVTSRTPSDSTGIGSFLVHNGHTLVWNHKWASYISSRVSAGLVKTSYEQNARQDRTKNYGIGFYHELGTRMRIGADWMRTDRDSNINTYDFKRNVYMLTLEAVL